MRKNLNAGSPSYVSLFSGCGGLDLGFHRSGFQGLASVDNHRPSLEVLARNIPEIPTQELDLSVQMPELSPSAEIDVLLAGSPCQGFSMAGLRKVDDPRNELILVACKFAKKFRPKVVIAENVPGVMSGSHRKYWDSLHGQLRSAGYKTYDFHADSFDFGVAQRRKRVFLIAWRTQIELNLNMDEVPKKVLNDVLKLPKKASNHEPFYLHVGTNDSKIANRIKQGQKLTNARGGELSVHTWDIPEVFGITSKVGREVLISTLRMRRQIRRRSVGDADPVSKKLLEAQFGAEPVRRLISSGYLRDLGRYVDLTHTFNGKYRRLNGNAPSRTVDTRFGDHRLFLHPVENRAFTAREAARIQGFEDSFVFSGSVVQQFRMIGNAVPPPMAAGLARIVKTLL